MAWFSHLDVVSVGGGRHNEDAVSCSSVSIIVADGASGLSSRPDLRDDAGWFSGTLASTVSRLLASGVPLDDVLALAMSETAAARPTPSPPPRPHEQPSASILIASLEGEWLHLVSLGDCSAVVRLEHEETIVVHDATVAERDQRVLDRVVRIAESRSISVRQALPDVEPMLRDNRSSMNTDDGYWVADLTGGGASRTLNRRVPAAEVDDILIASDGFMLGCDVFGTDPVGLLDQVRQHGVLSTAFEIASGLEGDPDFETIPRFKRRDDITAVFCRVGH